MSISTRNASPAARGAVSAWRWELELLPCRKETHLPLMFTFEDLGNAVRKIWIDFGVRIAFKKIEIGNRRRIAATIAGPEA